MSKAVFPLAAMRVVMALLLTTAAVGQQGEAKKSDPPKPAGDAKPDDAAGQAAPDMAKMMEGMKKWLEVVKPTGKHKELEQFVGTWDSTTNMMGMETKGVSTMKMVLDGRFLMHDAKGEMLMPDMATGAMAKVSYSGIGMTGYDNYKNLYVMTWADNLGTQLLTMTGTHQPGTKVYTYYGEMDEPMLDMHERMIKCVFRVIDNDHHTFEIYDLAAGENYKVFTIDYVRRK